MSASKSFNEHLKEIEDGLPNLAKTGDLVKTGLFSLQQLVRGRIDGATPPYMKIRGRYIYYKTDVIDWIKMNYRPAEQRGAE